MSGNLGDLLCQTRVNEKELKDLMHHMKLSMVVFLDCVCDIFTITSYSIESYANVALLLSVLRARLHDLDRSGRVIESCSPPPLATMDECTVGHRALLN
jgi:hypothetical protein